MPAPFRPELLLYRWFGQRIDNMFFVRCKLPLLKRIQCNPAALRARPSLEGLEDRTLPSSPGALDPTFGSGGILDGSRLGSPLPPQHLYAMALQPDGEIL